MGKIAPRTILIKGMLKSPLNKLQAVLREYTRLCAEGADIVRVAVPEEKSIAVFPKLRALNKPALVEADIHFNHRWALKAIEAGAQIVRLNPLNVKNPADVRRVIGAARDHGVQVRIGINSGGFRKHFADAGALARAMSKTVGGYLAIFEKEKFYDIIISLKAPSIEATYLANKYASEQFSYPLDVGITSSGPYIEGIVKSSIGISRLLTLKNVASLRVSLSAPSYMEIRVARYILQSLGFRKELEIITCPTCSRCKVNLFGMVDDFKEQITERDPTVWSLPVSVAIMGCEVNGPGEASQADLGIACGSGKAVLFAKGKQIRSVPAQAAVSVLVEEIRKRRPDEVQGN